MLELSFKQWQVESVRLTLFYKEEFVYSEVNWWSELVGVQPDTSVFKRRDQQLLEEGPLAGSRFALITRPDRIDWTLMGQNDSYPDEVEEPPFVSPEAVNKFYSLMKEWLSSDTCPSITRLAFGATLLEPVSNHEAGYRKLDSYLHDVSVDPSATDFFYRINRRRPSNIGINGLEVNRLTSWSASYIQRIATQLAFSPGAAPKHSVFPHEGKYFCRLELDINTVPEFKEIIPRDKYVTLLEELLLFAKEISEAGDIK